MAFSAYFSPRHALAHLKGNFGRKSSLNPVMGNPAIHQGEISSISEKERLDIIEKKIDIQKKRVELKKEKLNIDEIVLRRKVSLEEQKVLIDKVSQLRSLLSEWTIDEERTVLASEPFLKPMIVGRNRLITTNKLMELISKF